MMKKTGAKVEYSEFTKAFGGDSVSNVFLFEGEEEYVKNAAAVFLKEKTGVDDLNFVRLSGENLTLTALKSALFSASLFSGARLVLVSEYYPKEKQDDLNAVFADCPPDTVLAVFNKKPCDALKKMKAVTFVSAGKQSPRAVADTAEAFFRDNGVTAERGVTDKIAEYANYDLWTVKNECEKLIAFAGDKKEITVRDVDEIVHKETEYRIYEMTDAVGQKNFQKALAILSDMLAQGEAPIKLLSSVYYYFRKLFHTYLGANLSDDELSSALGVKPYAVKKMREQLKYFKIKDVKDAVDTLADLDFQAKSGARTMDDALMLGVFHIMTGGKR